uniref:Uncharacterized protein n=1 Tax=Bracon brevicornis TaxID=1563983 RepID=A0A6V7I072_9HYME
MSTSDGVPLSGPGIGNGARPTSTYPGGQQTQDGFGSNKTVAVTVVGTGAASTTAATAAPKRPPRRTKPAPDRPARALFFLPLNNPIRKLCIGVVEWKYPLKKKFIWQAKK